MFAWVICLIVATVAGVVPGVHASRWNIGDVLKTGSSRLTRSLRLRRGFVVAQIAVAMTLLVSAGLVGRSFVNLVRLDFGFDPRNVLTLDISIPDAPAKRRDIFYSALFNRVRGFTGVEAAGAILLRPLEHAGMGADAKFSVGGTTSKETGADPERRL